MNTETPAIPVETARHVLWHYGQDGGWQPGSFTQKLMQAIDSADHVNTEILRTAYPALVAAMFMAGNDRNGIEQLKKITEQIACADCGDTDGPFGQRVEGYVCEGCMRKRAL